MSKRIYKNLLVQYSGGGYDGCFWEWNYFLFDANGEFHIIAATGRKGITTREAAIACLNRASEECGASNEPYIYRLNVKKDVQSFQAASAPTHVATVVAKVNEVYGRNVMHWECTECGRKQYGGEMFHSGYHGNGGIGVEMEGMLCSDCYSSGYCESCEGWTDEGLTEVKTKHGSSYVCPDCVKPDVYKATSPEDAYRVAIHLLNPTDDELERAEEDARAKGFSQIVVHTDATWPKAKAGAQ